MWKRSVRIGVVIACLAVLVGLALEAATGEPRPRPTRANFARLRVGMPRPEVEAVLGHSRGLPVHGVEGVDTSLFYVGDHCLLKIFLKDGRLVRGVCIPMPSPVARWLTYFGLPAPPQPPASILGLPDPNPVDEIQD
jgi:hypothetical protein